MCIDLPEHIMIPRLPHADLEESQLLVVQVEVLTIIGEPQVLGHRLLGLHHHLLQVEEHCVVLDNLKFLEEARVKSTTLLQRIVIM